MVATDRGNTDGGARSGDLPQHRGARGRVSRGRWRIGLARDVWFDVMALAGLTLLAVGLWMVYPPLAFIVVGFLLLAGGVVGARMAATDRKSTDQE